MQIIRWAFLGAVGIVLMFLAVANRDPVTLRLVPDDLAGLVPVPGPVSVPVFLVIFAGILFGLVIGFLWEWMRERKHRMEATKRRHEVARLENEVHGLRKEKAVDKDEILALLD